MDPSFNHSVAAARSRGYPLVMGILNLTPDSFSDGGRFNGLQQALAQAEQMIEQGADWIDVGGESTRPNAQPVSEQQELERVLPLIRALRARSQIPISIDTSKPAVMRAAIEAGANLINDVRALIVPGALAVAAELKVPVCLMHMQGEPVSMQQAPNYRHVVAEVVQFLQQRRQQAVEAGIALDQIWLDPGFGFGKSLQHNLQLMAALPELVSLGSPVLVGVSRKSMIGQVLDREVGQRLAGGLALSVLAAQSGAAVIRTHDVQETRDALRMAAAVWMEQK